MRRSYLEDNSESTLWRLLMVIKKLIQLDVQDDAL